MYKLKYLLVILLAVLTGFSMIACSEEETTPEQTLDENLVGWWEGEIEENSEIMPILVTLGDDNTFRMMAMIPDDYSGSGGGDDAGMIRYGQRGTYTANGSTLEITITHEWDEDWVADADAQTMDYTLSSGNTVCTLTEPGSTEEIVVYRVDEPAIDTNLTGEWHAVSTEDNDGTPMDVRYEVVLGNSGTFELQTYDITEGESPYYTQSGSYGIYRSYTGRKYFTVFINSMQFEGETNQSVFYFQRLICEIDFFSTPDKFYLAGEMVFVRQGLSNDYDPPAPIAGVIGYWEGTENDYDHDHDGSTPEIDCTALVTFESNGSFERILLDDDGEMAEGMRGQFTTYNGDIMLCVEEFTSGGPWTPLSGNEILSAPYQLSGTTIIITMGDEEGPTEVTYIKIDEPAPSPDLTGTWTATGTEDLDDDPGTPEDSVDYVVILTGDAQDNFSLTMYESGTSNVIMTQSGTYGVNTINSTDYFNLIIDSMTMGGTPESTYWVSRYEYVFSGSTTFILDVPDDALTFTKQ